MLLSKKKVDKQLLTRKKAQADFEKALDQLARTQSLWSVFEDFLDYSLLMLRWQDRNESHFDELRQRYPDPTQHKLFAEAFYALADVADNDGQGFHDPFGDYFMEHFGNKFKGQFFTPDTITEFMAAIAISDDTPAGTTVCDPSCGSGRTLLSAAKHNRLMKFYAADIDINCCKMTAINMLMNSMEGEVAWMDSLRMEHWKSWHIRRVPFAGKYLPYYEVSGPGETCFIERLKATYEAKPEVKQQLQESKPVQLMLF